LKETYGMATATIDTRRFTREEYERLVEQGFFHPEEKLELVEGIIYEMTPQSSIHATGVRAATRTLESVFSEGFDVRPQLPFASGDDSEPEPDVVVVAGAWQDFSHAHPAKAVLIVEVAESSLFHDRKRKSRLYARAGIPEYWILNLVDWCLEVYREPKSGEYASRTTLREGDSVSPLARPETSVPVADLFPRR
jgi:Uma2 family endonuclease